MSKLKKVYLDTSVWNFLDGQSNTECEDLRPTWAKLSELINQKRLRLLTSIAVLQELGDAVHKKGDITQELCNQVVKICGRWIMSDKGYVLHKEIFSAAKRQRFSPWLDDDLIKKLRETPADTSTLKELATMHASQKQSGGQLLKEIERDFTERIKTNRLPLGGAASLAPDRIGAEIAEGMIRLHLSKEGISVSDKKVHRILKIAHTTRAFYAFLIAGAAERVPSQQPSRDADLLDAYHFALGAYSHWIVTPDSAFLKIAKRIQSYPARVMPLVEFCAWVKQQ